MKKVRMIRRRSPPTTTYSCLVSAVRLIDAAARYVRTETPLIFWEPQLLDATQFGRWGGWGSSRRHRANRISGS